MRLRLVFFGGIGSCINYVTRVIHGFFVFLMVATDDGPIQCPNLSPFLDLLISGIL